MCVSECVSRTQCLWLYLFAAPGRARHSLLSALVEGGRRGVALEIKTHEAGFGYLPFIHCSVMIFVHGDVHLCSSLLSNTTALCLCFSLDPCLLPDVTNPESLAIEAGLFALAIRQSF